MHHLVQLGPGPGLEILVPTVAAVGQHAATQHTHQRRVGAQKASLQVQREQADGHGLKGVLQLSLHGETLLVLLAHLLRNGQGRQQT